MLQTRFMRLVISTLAMAKVVFGCHVLVAFGFFSRFTFSVFLFPYQETPGPQYELDASLHRQTSSQRFNAPVFSFGTSKRMPPGDKVRNQVLSLSAVTATSS